MNLQEEILKMLKEQRGYQTEEVLAEALADLAEEWALECVGGTHSDCEGCPFCKEIYDIKQQIEETAK